MTADVSRESSPPNWPAVVLFSLTTLGMFTVFPWYAWTHDFSLGAWFAGLFCLYASGISITGGYHRLWAHRAYEAHWSLRVFYMLFGAMALQNSILIWASMHRVHHRHVDDVDHDPYSINRGLWFAHMSWMLRNYPSGHLDFSNARDLQADPIVMFQQRHYLAIALGMNVGVPLAIGACIGDPWGTLMIAGLLRLVVNHHFTFFINSLAHYWGRRPYTTTNTARDNDVLALFTYGEGYHNYHHLFQWDYRNGIRWWQWDPTKWLIAALSWIGVTRGLKRVPEFKIQRAMLQAQFEKLREKLDASPNATRLAALRQQFEQEMETFKATVAAWSQIQTERIEAARHKLADQWEHSELRARIATLEDRLREQRIRMQALNMRLAAV